VAAWDGTGPLESGFQMALKSLTFPRSGFRCVCRNEGGNWNWGYWTGTVANWHFTWRLTTNCSPVGTSETKESDACLTGIFCEVYISPPHTTPCDSALCSTVQLHLVRAAFICLWCFFVLVPKQSESYNFCSLRTSSCLNRRHNGRGTLYLLTAGVRIAQPV